MAQYHTNIADIPIILVGTQDAISESNPRLIDDTRARKLASDLKRCAYYETCATYGLNVERVFQDGEWLSGILYQFTYFEILPEPCCYAWNDSGKIGRLNRNRK